MAVSARLAMELSFTGGEFVRAEEGSSLALAVSGTALCNLKDQISEACILSDFYCVAVVHRW